jgi:hypothetical protein
MHGPKVPSAIPSIPKHDKDITRQVALDNLAGSSRDLSQFCQPSVMSLSRTLKAGILALK